jgi:hypothetical protein
MNIYGFVKEIKENPFKKGKYDIPTPSSSAERDVDDVVCLFPYLHIDQGFKFRQIL